MNNEGRRFPILRIAAKEDIPQIAQIEEECFGDNAWSERAFFDYFDNDTSLCLALFEDERLVGYICTYCLCGECEIVNVAVSFLYRRRGYGRKLLSAVIEHAKSEKITKLLLEVRTSNTAARALYESLGFYTVGVYDDASQREQSKNYYTDPKEDAVLMDLSLSQNRNEGEETDS